MLFFRLFRKVDPNCAYCRHGTQISERDVVCLRHGVVPVEYHCRAFRYDPLKRTPPRPAVLRLGGLGEADFSLDGAVPGQETLFAGMDGLEQTDSPEKAADAAELPEESPEVSALTEPAETVDNTAVGDTEAGMPAVSEVSEDTEDTEDTESDLPPEGGEAEGAVEQPESAEQREPVDALESPVTPASRTEKVPVKVKVRKIRR